MNIFLSWSGQRSHEVAELFDNWIQCVIQAVDPWLSSNGIDRGAQWFPQINRKLKEVNNGVIFLTRDNLDNPWILFESGAIAKGLEANRIFTFLIDLQPEHVTDPLAQFNHTLPNREDVFKLVNTINSGVTEKRLKYEILEKVFETHWPHFEQEFKKIIDKIPEKKKKPAPGKDELLGEILNSVRGIDRRLRYIENLNSTVDENNEHHYQNLQPVLSLRELNAEIKEMVSAGINDNDIHHHLRQKGPKDIISKMIEKAKLSEGISGAFL